MNIYNVNALTNKKNVADLVFASELGSNDNQHRLKGKAAINWEPIKFEWCLDDVSDKSDLIINDFVLVIGAGVGIALNEKAKQILETALSKEAQFLPIDILGDNSNWYLLNIVNRVDRAISEEKSVYKTLSTGKKILKKPVFNYNFIPENTSFVHPPAYHQWHVKGDFLKGLIEANGLTGLSFDICDADITTAS